MNVKNPLEMATQRIDRIHTVLHKDDLDEVQAYAEGFIDALLEFDHITQAVSTRLQHELLMARAKAEAKLGKKARDRNRMR